LFVMNITLKTFSALSISLVSSSFYVGVFEMASNHRMQYQSHWWLNDGEPFIS
jgi:hypothetical protein